MAVNLSIKNVPDALADKLRARAERNHRSLQGELMAILEHAISAVETGGGAPHPAVTEPAARNPLRLSIEEVAERAARLFPAGTPDSAGLIRAMRDGRYGDEWARSGRHAES
jgi:plasmid stability protein